MSADKTVAELMARIGRIKSAAEARGEARILDEPSDVHRISQELAADVITLEQAIRRALDWGEPVAFVNGDELDRLVAKGSAVLPSDRTWIEAVAVKDGWRTTPLYARRKDQ